MSTIRKRTWTTRTGKVREKFVVWYTDQHGKDHIKTFDRHGEAKAWQTSMQVEVRDGTHTAYSQSKTVRDAAEKFVASCRTASLEEASAVEYQRHIDLHINPTLGRLKLAELSGPMIRDFEDKLRSGAAPLGDEGKDVKRRRRGRAANKVRSQAMVKRIVGTLGAILGDALERGDVARNVVRELRSGRKRGKERRAERRARGKLKVGVDIPTPAEAGAIIEAAQGRWRPLLMTAIFTGLRSSELRGLRWSDVDLKARELKVHQRADRYNKIGAPKSESGERTVPLPKDLVAELREWKLRCPGRDTGQADARGGPVREQHYVFPNEDGEVLWHTNIIQDGLIPTVIAAGLCIVAKDADGKVVVGGDGQTVLKAKYTGLHALRHFFASWCINRKTDGGLELPAKVVQERLGHSTITMTLDVYGHLFPNGDDGGELDAAATALIARKPRVDTKR